MVGLDDSLTHHHDCKIFHLAMHFQVFLFLCCEINKIVFEMSILWSYVLDFRGDIGDWQWCEDPGIEAQIQFDSQSANSAKALGELEVKPHRLAEMCCRP